MKWQLITVVRWLRSTSKKDWIVSVPTMKQCANDNNNFDYSKVQYQKTSTHFRSSARVIWVCRWMLPLPASFCLYSVWSLIRILPGINDRSFSLALFQVHLEETVSFRVTVFELLLKFCNDFRRLCGSGIYHLVLLVSIWLRFRTHLSGSVERVSWSYETSGKT